MILVAALLAAEPEADSPGWVLRASGTGHVSLPAGGSVPLAVGQVLPIGSTVCTEAQSFATVRLAGTGEPHDHDEVTLLAETCVTVEASHVRAGERGSVVRVARGSVAVRENVRDHGAVTVRTAAGTTSGTAGGFRVTVEGEATSRTEAVSQGVDVTAGGARLALEAGYGSRLREGKPPEGPFPLPPPGSPLRPGEGAPLRRPEFSWSPSPFAVAYRVEISRDEAFVDVLVVEPRFALDWQPDALLLPLEVGGWWWRVCSIDRLGFVGAPSEARRLDVPAGMRP